MPEIKFTLSVANAARFVDAYCDVYAYSNTVSTIEDNQEVFVPNPESRGNFAKRMLKNDIKKNVKISERRKAREQIVEPEDIDID